MKPTATLLISTYNRPDFLKLVLTTVIYQTVMPEQIVIADDGSTGETKELIDSFRSKFGVPIIHVWHDDDGFRKTIILNKAIEQCFGDYIIQIDGDILLHPRFVEDHLSEAEKGFFVRGSRAMILENHTHRLISGETPLLPNLIKKGVKNRINGWRIPLLAYFYCAESNDQIHIMGCNFAYWRADMVRINGYNNDLFGWGHEDVEVAARLCNSGVKIKRVKFKAVCFHLYHTFCDRSLEDSNKQVFKQMLLNKVSECSNGLRQI